MNERGVLRNSTASNTRERVQVQSAQSAIKRRNGTEIYNKEEKDKCINIHTPVVTPAQIRIKRRLPTRQIVLSAVVITIIVALVLVNAVIVARIEGPIVHQTVQLLVLGDARCVRYNRVAVITHSGGLMAAAHRTGPAEVITKLSVQQGGQRIDIARSGIGTLRGGGGSRPGGRRLVEQLVRRVGVDVGVSVLDSAVGPKGTGVKCSGGVGGGLVEDTGWIGIVSVSMGVGVVHGACHTATTTSNVAVVVMVRESSVCIGGVGLFVRGCTNTGVSG